MNYKKIFGTALLGALLLTVPQAALAKDNENNGNRYGWFKHLFTKDLWKNVPADRADEFYAMCKSFIANHDQNGNPTAPTDTTAPVISALSVSDITNTSATLTWTTNESTRTQVSYGKTGWYNLYKDDTSFSKTHTMTLTGLAADTTYHFRVRAIDSSKNTSVTEDKTFKTLAATNSNPVISNITTNDVTGTSASIEWKTNEPTRTVLYWSTTSPIDKATTMTYNTNSSLATNHAMTINGLTVGTKYYFLIQSTDDDGNATTATEGTFTTAS